MHNERTKKNTSGSPISDTATTRAAVYLNTQILSFRSVEIPGDVFYQVRFHCCRQTHKLDKRTRHRLGSEEG